MENREQQEKKLVERKKAVKDIVRLVRLTRRMAIKIYIYNQDDEIFTDGTFTDGSLEVIKKEAAIVLRAIQLKEQEVGK